MENSDKNMRRIQISDFLTFCSGELKNLLQIADCTWGDCILHTEFFITPATALVAMAVAATVGAATSVVATAAVAKVAKVLAVVARLAVAKVAAVRVMAVSQR